MPPSSTSRARLTTGALAVLAAAALSAAAIGPDGALRPLAWLLAGLASVIVLGGLLWRLASAGPVAAAGYGAAFVTTLHDHGASLDGRTPLVAAGLLLLAELVAWSAETTEMGARIPSARRRLPRAAILAASVTAAWAATTALVAVAILPIGRDLALTAAGATAVAVVVAVLLGLAARRAVEPPPRSG